MIDMPRAPVGPLLASIDSGPICYVLTVGAENIALFRARRSGWTECDVPDLPRSKKDALWYERDERMSSSHAGGPTGARGMSIIGHGSGAQDEDRKDQLQRFFLKVDHAVVHFLLEDPETALVVAGTAPSALPSSVIVGTTIAGRAASRCSTSAYSAYPSERLMRWRYA